MKLLGIEYTFHGLVACDVCLEVKDVLRVLDNTTFASFSICESCSLLIHHAWSRRKDFRTQTGVDHTSPRSVRVLIARERKHDMSNPCDFLMLEDSDLGLLLPGGDLEHESPAEGACRLLLEQTDLKTWPGALEQLHLSHDVRGRLVQTFLCRAYSGVTSKTFVSAPLASHASFNRPLHLGVEQAFLMRVKLQQAKSAESPLCVHLSQAGALWIESKLHSMISETGETDSDRKLRDAYWMSMDTDEQKACRLVISLETSLRDSVSIGSPAQNFALASAMAERQTSSQNTVQANVVTVPSFDGQTLNDDNDDDNDVEDMFGERQSGGFVPPRK